MKRYVFILASLLVASRALADGGAAGWGLGLNCITRGDIGSGALAATTGTGFIGGGSCDRVPGLFTRLTFSTSNATMRTSTVYSLHTPSVLITPPFRTADVQPIFAVASACPVASGTLDLNWLFVQWTPTEQRDIVGSYVVGTATHTNGSVVITGQYDVAGTPYHLGKVPMPGSCDKSTGIYHVPEGEFDVRGDIFFTASGMGAFKTSAQRATFFFPRYQVTAAADFGGRTFRGIVFDSWDGNDIADVRNIVAVADGAGTSIVVEPLSDPETFVVDGTATYYRDTLTLSSINNPADGIITGTVTRTLASSGNGSGAVACIANKTGGDVLLFCSGQSPSDNSIPYNISLYFENRFNSAVGFGGRIASVAYDGNNGRAYVGGYFQAYGNREVHRIARVDGGGNDTSFATSGTGFDYSVESVYYHAASDQVYAGGWFQQYDGDTSIDFFTRFSSAGVIDTAFTAAGGPSYTVVAIAPDLANGRLWVGGGFGHYNGVLTPSLAAVKLDGSLDSTFVSGTGFNDWVQAVAWDNANGFVYVGGNFTDYDGNAITRLAKLSPTGVLDSTFAVGAGFDGEVMTLTLDSANRIYAGGQFSNYQGVNHGGLVRVASDGSFDSTFAVGTGFNGQVRAVKYDPFTDKIYVGGEYDSYDGTPVNYLVRLNLDGTIDSTFSVGTGFDQMVYSIDVEPGGRVWVAGSFYSYNGVASSRVVRLNSDGTLVAGTMPTQGGIGGAFVKTVALDSATNKIYVGGGFRSYQGSVANRILRFNDDGTRDASFVTGTGFDYSVSEIAVSSSGQVYAAGSYSNYDGGGVFGLNRLNSDGTLDSTFVGAVNDSAFRVTALAGNKVLVGGDFTMVNGVPAGRIAMLDNTGAVDASWVAGTAFDDRVRGLRRDPATEKIYVGGDFTMYQATPMAHIARLNSDGSLDTTFDVGTGADAAVSDFAVDPVSGKVYVTGDFTTYNGAPAPGIIRLLPDGTLDSTFVVGTGLTAPGFGFSLAYDPGNQRIVVGGYFGLYQGVEHGGIVRINEDGSADTSFGITTNGETLTVFMHPLTGALYVGGYLTMLNRVAIDLMARLSYSGVVE